MKLDPRRFSIAFVHQLILPIAALVACLTSYPGRVPADTKLYLYLDPLRLISDSVWSWDSRAMGGWVPHQNVGYLWPSGPFYALFDALHLPDWIAHRSWIALLMLIAGLGTYRLSRYLGLSSGASFLSAMAYQFSPYVLPYISRTSALLIPWSLLPWLIVLTLRYARHGRHRDIALFGLLIASSGGLNATALLMIAPAPVVWLIHLRTNGGITTRRLISTSLLLGSVAILTSAWWLAGLLVQGRYGAAVLSYSEALVSTSTTSSSTEVLRGLGYWLFYDKGPVAPLTSAAGVYQSSVPVLFVSGLLVMIGFIGLSKMQSWRKPLSVMLLVGLVLAIGAHPFGESNVLFGLLADHPKSALSLALRSSTRAVPLVVLALAIGIGSFWGERFRSKSAGAQRISFVLIIALIMANFPAAINGDIVDRALVRPQELPQAWRDAGRFLDERFDEGHTGAVLLVPGIESAAYRWGYPVDAILPAITRKPLLTRDWLPLGSPAVMDLLYALDDSFQNGTADPDSIAPVARMLGADTVMFVSSHQYERFDTVRPSRAFDVFDPVPSGLSYLESFGEPTINVSFQEASQQLWSEEIVAFPPRALPEIILYSVDEAGSAVRQFDGFQMVAADGTGLVDLGAASILDGKELTFSEASVDDLQIEKAVSDAAGFIITDSNRRRAHHWRGSQDVWGATEPAIGVLSVQDDFDSRLPVFSSSTTDSQTLIEESDVEAVATAYGTELRYHPEGRPRMAVDGDTATSWLVAVDRPASGQILTLRSDEPLDRLQLVQPTHPVAHVWITEISFRVDGGKWNSLELDSTSRSMAGQRFELPRPGRTIDLRIDQLNASGEGLGYENVGFAEVLPSTRTSPEIVRLPQRVRPDANTPVLISLARLRSDPFDRLRDDPERSIVRRLTPAIDEVSTIDAEVRLSPRANDLVLSEALGIDSGSSTDRLDGSVRWWAPSAFDGDPTTAWRGPVVLNPDDRVVGSLKRLLVDRMKWIEFEQDISSPASRVTSVELTFGTGDRVLSTSKIELPRSDDLVSHVSVPSNEGDWVSMSFESEYPTMVLDATTNTNIAAPIAISELRSNAWTNSPLPSTFDTGCTSDIISIGGRAISIRLSGSVQEALNGNPVRFSLCPQPAISLTSDTLLSIRPGTDTGWDVDRLSIHGRFSNATSPPEDLSYTSSRSRFQTLLSNCKVHCWVEAPFGYSNGWSATFDGSPLEPIRSSAAGRSVWEIPPTTAGTLIARWKPQLWMWLGLGVSATTILILLAMLFADRRHRSYLSPVGTNPSSKRGLTTGNTRTLRRAVVGFALGALVVTPTWGALIALALLVLRRSVLLRLSVFGVGLGFVFLVLQQVRTGADPGFGWPTVFERSHRPMLATVVLFVLAQYQESANPFSRPRILRWLPRR